MFFVGAWTLRTLHNHHTSKAILWWGILVLLGGASFFVIATIVGGLFDAPHFISIGVTVGSMSVMAAGSSMIIPNCLSLALEDYQHAVGTASSLFGFFYYALIFLLYTRDGIFAQWNTLPNAHLLFWNWAIYFGRFL